MDFRFEQQHIHVYHTVEKDVARYQTEFYALVPGYPGYLGTRVPGTVFLLLHGTRGSQCVPSRAHPVLETAGFQ
eukprot:490342-Rhodomonas_salina.1